jgi:acylphosphatase
MAYTAQETCVQRRHCLFSGRVQGVGFRYTVNNIAMQYDVHGYVRNLPDGRVELVIEGRDHDLEAIVEAVKQKMECFIHRVDDNILPATGEFDHFSIRH